MTPHHHRGNHPRLHHPFRHPAPGPVQLRAQASATRRCGPRHPVLRVCHTGIHPTRDDWGRASDPMVPCHEVEGCVTAVGAVPCPRDLSPYIPTLAVGGSIALVGYLGPVDPSLNTSPVVLKRKAVAGSLVGGIANTQELLDFCGQHGINADNEMIRIQDINAAQERMMKSEVKYRFVIDLASPKNSA